jgi:hypothetical protein
VLIPAPEHPVPPESERSFSMKAKKTLFGFAALFLAAVFSLTSLACKNEEEDDSGGGGRDSALVGKWYSSLSTATENGNSGLKYEFKEDGTESYNTRGTWSTSGTTLSLTIPGGYTQTATYTLNINGTTLTLTDLKGDPVGLESTTYYKGGSGASGGGTDTGGTGTGGTGTGGTSTTAKPAELSSSATSAQAISKLDAIIAYCDAHPSAANDNNKVTAQGLKNSVNSVASYWTQSNARDIYIPQINTLIGQLE